MIKYIDSLDNIEAGNLTGFFIGWPKPPSAETLLQILQKSAYIVLAINSETGQVIGFINAISDFTLAAYIPLLEVIPDYQKRGIGKELMRLMLKKLKDLYMIDLMCDKELESFYARQNMKPAFGMMIRNFDKQSGCS
jgi:ribosomal protein S18 acetylase RimI-like enzyme